MKEEQPSRKGSQKQSKQSAARVPLFLQPLKPLPGESRSEFASRGLLEIKRGLIERLRAEEENRK